jgi:hypothetical protein
VSFVPGTLVQDPLSPGDSASPQATHDAEWGRGGIRWMVDHAARDAISVPRRSDGMWVGTLDDGKMWMLGSDLTTWTERTFGSGTPGLITDKLVLSAIIRPTVNADQDNWAPTGLATASTIIANVTSSRLLTGLTGGADGRTIALHNGGTSDLTIKDESASSTAANRFALANDFLLAPDSSLLLQYDGTAARWRLIGAVPRHLSNFQGSSLYNVRDATTLVTANTYTALDTDSGRIIQLNDPTGVALSLASTLPVGWRVRFVQYGAGQVTFGGTATLHNRPNRTKTYGQWAVVDAEVIENGGTAVVVLSGDVDTPSSSPAVMVGDSGSGGVQGLAPAPAAGDAAAGKVLLASGGWGVPAAPSGSSNQYIMYLRDVTTISGPKDIAYVPTTGDLWVAQGPITRSPTSTLEPRPSAT